MSAFPFSVAGNTVRNQEELRELLRAHAHAGPLRRQDEHPAEAWFVSIDEEPGLRGEVDRLAAEMVRVEEDPAVLRMIVALAGVASGFAEAAALRLVEGPPVPDAPGAGFAKIAEDLWDRAGGVADSQLLRRLIAIGRPLDLLRLALHRREPDLVGALERAAEAGEVPVPVVGTVAIVVAHRFPEQIGRAAAAVRGMSEKHRRTFLRDAAEVSPELRATIEAALG